MKKKMFRAMLRKADERAGFAEADRQLAKHLAKRKRLEKSRAPTTETMMKKDPGCAVCGEFASVRQSISINGKRSVRFVCDQHADAAKEDDAAKVWNDNQVQFPRLLAEIRAVGLTEEQYEDLQTSMDLSKAEIDELLERAETKFEADKAAIRS